MASPASLLQEAGTSPVGVLGDLGVLGSQGPGPVRRGPCQAQPSAQGSWVDLGGGPRARAGWGAVPAERLGRGRRPRSDVPWQSAGPRAARVPGVCLPQPATPTGHAPHTARPSGSSSWAAAGASSSTGWRASCPTCLWRVWLPPACQVSRGPVPPPGCRAHGRKTGWHGAGRAGPSLAFGKGPGSSGRPSRPAPRPSPRSRVGCCPRPGLSEPRKAGWASPGHAGLNGGALGGFSPCRLPWVQDARGVARRHP